MTHSRLLCGTAFLSVLVCLPATAQTTDAAVEATTQVDTAPATPAKELEDSPQDDAIVVTGEKITRTLQDTQSSVAVLTGRYIESSTIQELADTFTRVANVVQTEGEEGFSIRGIANRGVVRDNRATASVYVDGAVQPILGPFADAVDPLSLWDVRQVEIFRGSQSTVQGRNSLAGAIIVRTANPTWQWEGKARGIVSSFDGRQLAGAVSGPVVNDRVAVRFAVDKRKSDGYVKNSFFDIDDADYTDSLALRGKVLITPAGMSNLRILATINQFNVKSGDGEIVAASGDTAFDPFDRTTEKTYSGLWKSRTRQGIVEASLDVAEGVTLTSVTAIAKQRLRRGDRPGTTIGFTPFLRYTEAVQAHGDVLTQELRASVDRGPLRGVAGIYYADVDTVSARQIFFVPGRPTPNINQRFGNDANNKAVFGQLEYDIGRITVIGGARYDHEKNKFESRGQPTTKNTYSAFLPKAGVVYNFTDDVSLGFTAQRAYRAGGSGISFLGREYTFDPEYTWNYEAAFRSELIDNRLYLNANAFYTDWKDQQVDVSFLDTEFGTPDTITDNAGKSELKGFEAEITGKVMEGLEVFGSLGYVKTKFKSPDMFAGNRFPYAPKLQASAGATYRSPAGIFVNGDISTMGSFYSDALNSDDTRVRGRTIVNGKVGYEAANWGAFLFARNLLDKEYLNDARRNQGIFGSTYRIGQPRTIGLELTGRF